MRRNSNSRRAPLRNYVLTPALCREMEESFGVPIMRLPLSALAVSPRYLPVLWKTLKPVVETGDFFYAAQRLQADAYTRMFNYFRIPDLYAGAAGDSTQVRGELTDFVELFQARSALFLLFFSLQAQALDGPVGRSRIPAEVPARPLFPQIHWEEEEWENEEEPSAIEGRRSQLKEMRRDLEFALVTKYPEYMVLGRWPSFFSSYRDCLKTVMASPLHGDWQHSVRSLAWHLVQELPGPVELSVEHLRHAGVQERDLGALAHVSDAVMQNLSGLLLNLVVARIGLEQGSRPAAPSGAPVENPAKTMSVKPGRVA